MKIRDQFVQEMNKLQKSVAQYQEKWQQTGYSNPHQDMDLMTDDEIGKRIKRNLRVQDQNDNLKRILNQQKTYKMLLVQDLMVKERKAKELLDCRKSFPSFSMSKILFYKSQFIGTGGSAAPYQ